MANQKEEKIVDKQAQARWYDDETATDYPPDLYRYATVIRQGIDNFAAVTDEDVARFHQQGYLVVHNAFSLAEVETMKRALLDLLAGYNPDFDGVQYEQQASDLDNLTPDDLQDAVRKFWRFVEYDERLKRMAQHPALLSVLGRFMGDTPELFQDMALFKPPVIGREKPWHQDCAYFNLPLETIVVGAWIALDEATTENGCMQIIPGSHREGPVIHFRRRDWQICDTDVVTDRVVAVPLPPGGCLLFHGLLHHGTPANRSNQRRRAVQFHYKPASVNWGSEEERLAVFGSEGKGVTC